MKVLALIFAFPLIASAQDPGTLLGAGIRSRPDYDGASKQELEPIPVVRYYGPLLFARTTQGILEGGARRDFGSGVAGGAQLAYEGGNDRTDLGPGASIGLHVEWDTKIGPAPVNVLFRTRTNLDTDRGGQADLRATVGVYGRDGILAGVFVQQSWASDKRVRSYYGAGQGGLLHTDIGIEGAYDITRRWVAVASVSLRRLHGDAATSPITEEKTNTYASAGIAYRF